jgi:hypothetical protein
MQLGKRMDAPCPSRSVPRGNEDLENDSLDPTIVAIIFIPCPVQPSQTQEQKVYKHLRHFSWWFRDNPSIYTNRLEYFDTCVPTSLLRQSLDLYWVVV